jgi:hypothetical protein
MSEHGKENIHDSEVPTGQRRPPGIVKIAVVDQIPVERAGGRDIAFNDVHAKLPTPQIARSSNFHALGNRNETGAEAPVCRSDIL